LLSATFRVLAGSGYLKGEERIDRHKLAKACMELLLAQPVQQADQAEIEQKALIVAEIRSRLFTDNGYGEDVEKDLDVLLSQIVASDGAVQMLLGDQTGDKHVLCSKRVTRQLVGIDGRATMTLKRSGKFVSRDPDVIEQHYYAEALARFERSTTTVKNRLERAEERQPLLAARRLELVSKAHEYLQLALPVGGREEA
jgi:hypothetical protein